MVRVLKLDGPQMASYAVRQVKSTVVEGQKVAALLRWRCLELSSVLELLLTLILVHAEKCCVEG